MGDLPGLIWLLAVVVAGLALALHDLRDRIVPNRLILALVALFLLGAVMLPDPDRTRAAALIAAALLVPCIGLFALRLLPGGDAKAIPAIALLVPPDGWMTYLIGVWLLTAVLLLIHLPRRASRRAGFPLLAPLGLALSGQVAATGPLADLVTTALS